MAKSKSKSNQKSEEQIEALTEMREIFEKVATGEYGDKLTKDGAIRIGGYGTDRYLVLMYYHVGFALFEDNGLTPPGALAQTALNFANKYYRNTL